MLIERIIYTNEKGDEVTADFAKMTVQDRVMRVQDLMEEMLVTSGEKVPPPPAWQKPTGRSAWTSVD